MERHGEEVDVTTEEARGGSTPNVMRYVLLISLFLAAAVMTIVWVTGAMSVDDPVASGAERTSDPYGADGEAAGAAATEDPSMMEAEATVTEGEATAGTEG